MIDGPALGPDQIETEQIDAAQTDTVQSDTVRSDTVQSDTVQSDTARIGEAEIEQAAQALMAGRLVAFPTETVYGLGADAGRADAVAKIYAAKSRPVDHPLIVHVGLRSELDRLGRDVSADAAKLADAFWPGPLTIIVGRGSAIDPATVGGRPTVGLRMPDHPMALALLRRFAEIGSGAVAAPSANRFGGVSPTTVQHVIDDLGDVVDVILDGGPCRVGVESTIVDATGPEPELLRPGGISTVELEAVLGRPVIDRRHGPARAPGMLASHYAPQAQVRLVSATEADNLDLGPSDGLILVGDRPEGRSGGGNRWWLPTEAAGYAAQLYATLRAADINGVRRLFVVAPTDGRLLDAVLDRLTKAAAPRTEGSQS